MRRTFHVDVHSTARGGTTGVARGAGDFLRARGAAGGLTTSSSTYLAACVLFPQPMNAYVGGAVRLRPSHWKWYERMNDK